MALAIGGLGLVAWREGGAALNEAKQFYEESLALCREIGHQSHIHTRLVTLGQISNSLGRYKEAEGYFQEAWELSKQLGRKAEVSLMVAGLGGTALGLGDFGAARRYLLEALKTPRLPIALEALVTWAALLKQEADLPALPQSSPFDKLRTSLGEGKQEGGQLKYEQKQQAVEILSLVLNHPSVVQLYKDKAAYLLAELEAELPPEVVAAAWERGRTQTVGEMVAKIVGETRS
jgi:tetratricopeptide (TPR) repeat protein